MRGLIGPASAAAFFYLTLASPNHPAALSWAFALSFPLELPALLLGLWLVPPHRARAAALVVAAVLGMVTTLKALDFAMFTALSRGFNPVGDWALVAAAWRLGSGAVGVPLAMLICLAGLLSLGALFWLLYRSARTWARLPVPRARVGLAAASIAATLVAGYEAGALMGAWPKPIDPPGTAFSLRVAAERTVTARETLADLRDFRRAARDDPAPQTQGLFAEIDRDVLVIFLESYGRASHDGPLYAPTHRATLARAEATLRDLGLGMRSGFLSAPTQGGQSWLSHISFATGLWVGDQARYAAALSSGRQGLFHLARAAGFHTAAVMPAITLYWPEAARMGFETVLDAAALGYRGQPFNWVTMPDQFTLSAMDRLLRAPGPRQPLFAQVALISSHAPWVPVPELVAWETVGDGRVFDGMAQSGDPPEVVWRDRDRVRDQYRLAVDYALEAALSYAARAAGPEAPLILLVGDHQAAGFVAQDERPDVPIHVIGPPHLVERLDDWGWQDGLLPASDAHVTRMDKMRDRLIEAFSATPAPQAGG
jgi:hypothetical protein